jgi:hypothetical protein
VLVVGAGPTGLLTALQLAERGLHVELIEEEWRSAGHSYALALHGRSLARLAEVGVADEAIAAGRRGRALAWLGERLRRAVDLEHWAAFRVSFDRLARLIVRVGTGAHGRRPPASICVISGDVHHTYASEVVFRAPMKSRVHQLTCSPFHNSIPLPMRLVFSAAWSRWAERFSRRLASFARVAEVDFAWTTTAGPYFGNHLALLTFDARSASFALFQSAVVDGVDAAVPVPDASRDLTPPSVDRPPLPVPATA